MQRILINLTKEEWEALVKLAEKEYRPARYQAELIFRDALSSYGIIKLLEPQEKKQSTKKARQRDQFPNVQPT